MGLKYFEDTFNLGGNVLKPPCQDQERLSSRELKYLADKSEISFIQNNRFCGFEVVVNSRLDSFLAESRNRD